MRIGELGERTGVTTKTIRYYESIGLLEEPDRTASGYRDYAPDTVDRLRFIRDAQATGLTLTEIASILELRGQGVGTCEHVIDLLDHHLRDLAEHIETLQRTRARLLVLTERARGLDPTDCTDPNRCQTIAETSGRSRHHSAATHLHEAPHRHEHQAAG